MAIGTGRGSHDGVDDTAGVVASTVAPKDARRLTIMTGGYAATDLVTTVNLDKCQPIRRTLGTPMLEDDIMLGCAGIDSKAIHEV